MARIQTLLKAHEKAIDAAVEAARDHFAVIGSHLMAIRDGELFKEHFDTFEAYVLERWEFTRQYAYRLISSAKTIEDLSTAVDKGTPLPETERQVREIEKSEPEARAEVWTTAQEIGGTDQPKSPVIQKAAEIVTTGKPVNHESLEIDDAIESFQKLQKKLIAAGQRIQVAFDAKVKVCQAMATRQVKFRNLVDNLASRADLLREDIEDLSTKWASTKKQVDQ